MTFDSSSDCVPILDRDRQDVSVERIVQYWTLALSINQYWFSRQPYSQILSTEEVWNVSQNSSEPHVTQVVLDLNKYFTILLWRKKKSWKSYVLILFGCKSDEIPVAVNCVNNCLSFSSASLEMPSVSAVHLCKLLYCDNRSRSVNHSVARNTQI